MRRRRTAHQKAETGAVHPPPGFERHGSPVGPTRDNGLHQLVVRRRFTSDSYVTSRTESRLVVFAHSSRQFSTHLVDLWRPSAAITRDYTDRGESRCSTDL